MIAEFAVVGGRGKTGRAVIAAVEASGGSALPLGRAELRDPVTALRGVAAAYVMAPNLHPDEPGFVRDLLAAAEAAGVPRVVFHSVTAPYLPEMPHHLGKAEAERLVRASPLEWVILQPCAYVQNFVPQVAGAGPTVSVPYDPDAPFGLVDLADVADVAAVALSGGVPAGSTLELGGAETVSVRDVARAAALVRGQDVPLRRTSSAEWAAGPGAAMDVRERDWLTAMFDHYDRHGLRCGPLGVSSVLGRPPRTIVEVLRRELTASADR